MRLAAFTNRPKPVGGFQEKAESIKGKVKSAMFYPVAVMVVATIIVGVLMTFVIPKFKRSLRICWEKGQLPGFTLLVLAISDAIKNNVLAVLGGGGHSSLRSVDHQQD